MIGSTEQHQKVGRKMAHAHVVHRCSMAGNLQKYWLWCFNRSGSQVEETCRPRMEEKRKEALADNDDGYRDFK